MQGSNRPDKIYVVDNSLDSSAYRHLYTSGTLDKYAIEIWPMNGNIGVAASWNKFMQIDEDYIIIANDDIKVHYHTIEHIVNEAERQTDQIFFAGAGESGNAFSLFLLTTLGYKLIGAFDEKFYPAYFEDNDYAWRMLNAGYSIIEVPNAHYDHVGSSTLKSFSTAERRIHDKNFQRNQSYYIFKWGGLPHHEIRKEPRVL
jgi:GT2 family glycosyltransferase